MKKSIEHVRTGEIKAQLRLDPKYAGIPDKITSVSKERAALRDSLRVSDEWAAKFDAAKSVTAAKKVNTELNKFVKEAVPNNAAKIKGLHKEAAKQAGEEAGASGKHRLLRITKKLFKLNLQEV
jgi:hypothetical protein